MGMPVRIRFYCPPATRPHVAASTAFARVAALDRMMSDYRPDSELSRLGGIGRGAGSTASPDLFAVLERAVEIARVRPVAPSIPPSAVGRALARRAQDRRMPDRDSAGGRARACGLATHRLDPSRRAVRLAAPEMRLDLGGIAKGYILQQALALDGAARRHARPRRGWRRHRRRRRPARRGGWRIDVSGADATFAARAARLTNAALATSGPDGAVRRDRRRPILARRRSANRLGLTNHVDRARHRP